MNRWMDGWKESLLKLYYDTHVILTKTLNVILFDFDRKNENEGNCLTLFLYVRDKCLNYLKMKEMSLQL